MVESFLGKYISSLNGILCQQVNFSSLKFKIWIGFNILDRIAQCRQLGIKTNEKYL